MSKPVESDQQAQESGEGAFLTATDGRRFEAVPPMEPAVSSEETTDTVVERLGGNFSQDVIDEVRKYGKPQWEITESSLDPVEDIEDFYNYDFKLPPKVHDAYVEAAADEIMDLESLKGPTDPALLAKIEQRKKLVEGRHADDVKWMKHKAYYRGIRKVRAAKKQIEQAVAEEADTVAAAAAASSVQQPQQLPQSQQQPYQQRLSLYSENEILAGISSPSEWEEGWNAPSYQQHPEVLEQLRSSFAACMGIPYLSPQQQREQEQQLQQALAAEQARQQQEAELEAARQAYLAKHTPYQAYTPEYLEQQKRQQQLEAHRRHKQQAFWLSLGLAVGSSVVRWWHRRGQKQQQQQLRRRNSQTSSRRSTRPPTPVFMVQEAIAE